MAKKTVKYMLTAFRDGFQSVVGARVLSKDFLPCVEECYDAGVRWFEAGGGARFQSCYFYCQEDAFDVMDKFRKAAPEADLQTLSRGVNVVGLESQPSDMIKLHAQMFKKHGMTSIRNFDALNDVNNLKWSGQCIHDAGLKHEVVVTMMGLPPGIGLHTICGFTFIASGGRKYFFIAFLKLSSAFLILLMSKSKPKSGSPSRQCHIVMMSGWHVPPDIGAIERSSPSAPPRSAAR